MSREASGQGRPEEGVIIKDGGRPLQGLANCGRAVYLLPAGRVAAPSDAPERRARATCPSGTATRIPPPCAPYRAPKAVPSAVPGPAVPTEYLLKTAKEGAGGGAPQRALPLL